MATLLITVDRPRTVPLGIFAITGSLFITQLTVLVESDPNPRVEDLPSAIVLLFSLLATLSILLMPFRDLQTSNDSIGQPGESPTCQLRSPEDNLSLWQFMSVTWMYPLISLGSKRQLNEDDVWSLAFQFQHKTLHEKFRELKGSVVKRLLAANGLDLIIISALGILECLASERRLPLLLYQAED